MPTTQTTSATLPAPKPSTEVATAKRSAHDPWSSPTSAWVTSAALGVGVLLVAILSGHDTMDWWFSGTHGGGPRILAPLTAVVSGFGAAAAVTVSWWRPYSATLLLLIPTAEAMVSTPSLGWWLAIAVVAALQTIRGAWVAAVTWLGAVAATYLLCVVGQTFSTPYGRITLDRSSAPYFQVWLALLALALAASLTTRALLRARRRAAAAGLAAERAADASRSATASAAARTSLAAERSQVARDLHDVVAHHVSLIAVRAESARYTGHHLDDEARETLDAIADDARKALTELRSALTVLDRSVADGGDTTEASRAPQPGACDVANLLSAARAVGQDVHATPDGTELVMLLADIPSAPGYVLARCVQESLTNARRHAPGEPVTMTLDVTEPASTDMPDPRHLILEISNPVDSPEPVTLTPGRGLVGLHERVAVLGGRSSAGVVDGRYTVHVEIPLGQDPASAGTD